MSYKIAWARCARPAGAGSGATHFGRGSRGISASVNRHLPSRDSACPASRRRLSAERVELLDLPIASAQSPIKASDAYHHRLEERLVVAIARLALALVIGVGAAPLRLRRPPRPFRL